MNLFNLEVTYEGGSYIVGHKFHSLENCFAYCRGFEIDFKDVKVQQVEQIAKHSFKIVCDYVSLLNVYNLDLKDLTTLSKPVNEGQTEIVFTETVTDTIVNELKEKIATGKSTEWDNKK